MPKKVTFDVTANTKGAQKGLSDLGKTTGVLSGVLGKLGPVGNTIASVLDKLGVKNIDAAAGFGLATAAVGAAIKVGEDAINQYVTLGEAVRHYAVITGQSAEESSKQVEAFGELGVAADVAAAGMMKLAKAVATQPKKLEELGVAIAHNVDGTVNLNATLINVIDAWQKQGDAAKRDQIILTAFGKSGAALIPILEANSAQLKRLEDNIAQVYTSADLDAIKQYNIAQKEAKASADEWGLTLGRTLLPAQKAVYDSLNENVYVSKNFDAAMIKLTGSTNGSYAAQVQVDRELRAQWVAAQNAQVGIDSLAASQLAAAQAAQTEADAENTLYDAIHKNVDAHLAYRQALINLTKAQKDASAAKGKDKEANLRLEEAMYAVADAAVAQAVAQAALKGQTLTAHQQAQIQIKTLEHLEKTVKKGSPLYKSIEAYIKLLQSIPADVNTSVTFVGTRGGKPTKKKAAGGPVSSGEAYTVGESGPETLVMGSQGGNIIPNGRGGGQTINIHIHGMINDGPAMDRFTNQIARRLQTVVGG